MWNMAEQILYTQRLKDGRYMGSHARMKVSFVIGATETEQ
jgi:hypothetical protein